jgi:cytochrome c oxidase cbb3-type subunit III
MTEQKHQARRVKVSRRLCCYLFLCGIIQSGSIALVAQQSKKAKAPGQPDAAGVQARRDYETRCSSCHGLDGRGGERAPNIATDPAIMTLPGGDIFKIIRNGLPSKGMPAFGYLSDAQIKSMVSFLRLMGTKSGWQFLSGNPAQGGALFFGKAGCGQCHMMRGRGGFLGSDLTEYAATHSPGEAREVILNPGRLRNPNQEMVEIVTRAGEQFSGVVRNEDNFSFQLMGADGAFHNFMKSDVERMERSANPIMPADYGRRLDASELNDLVSYLATGARCEEHSTKKPIRRRTQ